MGKKLLMVLAAFFLLCSGAYAVEVKFHGVMWNLVGAGNNNDIFTVHQPSGKSNYYLPVYGDVYGVKKGLPTYTDELSGWYGLTKARFRAEVMTDDGLAKLVWGQEVGTVGWGDGGNGFSYSGDGRNVETRFVYTQFKLEPFGLPGYVRVGLQPTKINTWVWTETAPGLTYHYKDDCLKLMAGFYRVEADNNALLDGSEAWVLKADYKVDDKTTLGGFFIYHDMQDNGFTVAGNPASPSDYYIGFTGSTTIDPVMLAWDLIYLGGETKIENMDDVDRSAWFARLTAGFQVNEQFKVTGTVAYASGDDDINDEDADNFLSIDVDVPIGIAFFKDSMLADCDMFFSEAPYFAHYGYTGFILDGTYQIDDKSKIRGAFIWHRTAEDVEWTDNSGNSHKDKDMGYEFAFWYDYQYNKNVSLRVEGTYLIAGDALNGLANDGDADDFYYVGTGVKFKF
ncbi:hypothetical protein [Thermodesulfatator autotrophicus]|nr:hypothetical protein [Thermodesulfatator autotrophicus]